MFELRPLHPNADKLRPSPFQLSLRRHHVGRRHRARSVLVLHNLQAQRSNAATVFRRIASSESSARKSK